MARPMPCPPPVTMARRPSSVPVMASPLLVIEDVALVDKNSIIV
jgi:hypothetical protein